MSAVVEAAKSGARWAQVNLGVVVNAANIELAFPAEKAGIAMKLFMSDDGSSWVVVLSGGLAKWVAD